MNETITFSSALSFAPLIRELEKVIETGRQGKSQWYLQLLGKVREHPQLLRPITDLSILEQHKDLIEQLMSTVFPITLSEDGDFFGGAIPFQFKLFYASRRTQKEFLDPQDGSRIVMPECTDDDSREANHITGAYQLVLNRLFNMEFPSKVSFVHDYHCEETGLRKYMEIEMDTRFIDIHVRGELPQLPQELKDCCHLPDIFSMANLRELLPLDMFAFEGMVIIEMRDVTEREVLNVIRNQLLDLNTFSDTSIFLELQKQVQNLIGMPNIHTAVKPFFRVNNQLVLTEIYTNTVIKSSDEPSEELVKQVHKTATEAFSKTEQPLVLREIDKYTVAKYPFTIMLEKLGWKSAIICPLFTDDHEMLGVLLFMSREPARFDAGHIRRIEPAIPLFKLAMEKSQENLDHQVDRVIRDQFTAVQDAVEWRFTQEALRYLTRKQKAEQVKINPIVFQEVYPLYGAIDIRNSSVERNHAIQLDLLEQLNLAEGIVQKAAAERPFPLLEAILFKLKKYVHAVSNILFADEEAAILQFLRTELVELFRHLQRILPALKEKIDGYFTAIDSPVEMVYHHRREYEESITAINTAVSRFIDQEQEAAQKIFPHYFERFVTDGVDFNIYIGQSITPTQNFDFFYLKNLKIWQLSTLAKAARLTHYLERELPLPLQTSQLILAHSHPISISFRTAERKFDVDGAYNIRYEIIKKRIDKVHIKDSHERLTKPGHIAIVYSQATEASEYMEYIEFLTQEGLLLGEVERFELEELQGVGGLKGLRVAINVESTSQPKKTSWKEALVLTPAPPGALELEA